MRISTLFRKLLGVTAMVVTAVSFAEVGLLVDVLPRWRKPRCGGCGRRRGVYDRSPPRLWRHLALGRTVFWLRYAPRRVNCSRCGVRVEQVPWAAHGSRFTRDLEEMVAYLAQRMDRSAVRRLVGIDWRTVGTIVERIVSERLDPARLDELYVIGLDELSFRRHHNYVTVVVDHLKRRVVWTGEGRSADTLHGFFDALGPERSAKLTHVTLDMAAGYIKAVTERAPQAQKVYDRFHVQQLASAAVDQVRRTEVHLAGAEAGRLLKKSRWPLLKSTWNLEVHEREKLGEVQRTNRRLYRAYLLKESLGSLLDYRQPWRARRRLAEWLSWASRSKLRPFVRVARTIRHYMDGVLAYVSTRLSNGLTEGLNNKTRLITRRAYGFHSAHALSAMIHLCCGGIVLSPPLPGPTYSP